MDNSYSSPFVCGLATHNGLNTSQAFPLTPTKNKHQSFSATRIMPSQGSKFIASSQISPTNTDAGGHGRVKMQTRIAIRDTTPHRFQIIPLREVKNNCNPEIAQKSISPWYKLQGNQNRSSDTDSTHIPTLFFKPSYSQQILSPASSLSSTPEYASDTGYIILPNEDKDDRSNSGIEPIGLSKSTSTQSLDQGNGSCWRPVKEPDTLLCQASCLLHTSTMGRSNVHKKGAKSEIISQPPSNDRPSHQKISNQVKTQEYSEEPSCQPIQDCGHIPARRGEQMRCPNKRHAIYADSMVLPFFSKIDFSESILGQKLLSPITYPPQADHPFCRHPCVQTCCFKDTSDWSSGQNLTVQTGSCLAPPPLFTDPGHPPVARLCIRRKLPATGAKFVSKAAHTTHINHSKTILDLLSQLDKAVEEWADLERFFGPSARITEYLCVGRYSTPP